MIYRTESSYDTGLKVLSGLEYKSKTSLVEMPTLSFSRTFQGNTRWIQPSDKLVDGGRSAVFAFHFKPMEHIGQCYYKSGSFRYMCTYAVSGSSREYYMPSRFEGSSSGLLAGDFNIFNSSYSPYIGYVNGIAGWGTNSPSSFTVTSHSSNPKIETVRAVETYFLISCNCISKLKSVALFFENSSGGFEINKEYGTLKTRFDIRDTGLDVHGARAYVVHMVHSSVNYFMPRSVRKIASGIGFDPLSGTDSIEILEAIYQCGVFDNN